MRKKMILNKFFWLTLSFSVGGLSFFRDLYISQPHWFQRSGSLITVFGIFLGARKFLSIGIRELIKDEYTIDGGNASTDFDKINNEAELNVISCYLGMLLSIIGTIIWGYGELIFRIIIHI